jgi:hypothetical protein
MSNCGNANILNRIFNNIDKFRAKEISSDDMISNLSANLTALEGMSSEFINNFQCFLGEIDFIKYTETPDLVDDLILKEVNEYANYLKQHF